MPTSCTCLPTCIPTAVQYLLCLYLGLHSTRVYLRYDQQRRSRATLIAIAVGRHKSNLLHAAAAAAAAKAGTGATTAAG